ncbi:methyltransferase domain-containing protein [Roseofilum sp. BLCC_M154]|uniref:Methyltransferase domain-containing protein n=1 Tax=Roseofilum acuticapitatum BLCC-M154 TaxID=3022444 RepID=A0ABT7ATH1_9CYAN|nr:class I SAM-dependent methyltransferase [Roseofilum acuticapitatum]MDJ1170204.1 methyltransferase domain-containing protein [Roseofilum acuticapitatum BLCC-M154]
MVNPLAQLAYQGWQQTKNALSLTHKSLSYQLSTLFIDRAGTSTPVVDAQVLSIIQQRLDALLSVDWQDATLGVYPMALLFEEDWQYLLSTYPMLWFDLPGTWRRKNDKEYQAFSSDLDRSAYPRYYLQNFHYQTDGYLSDRSAELYDLQVDILFNGAADAMRRRVLAPLKQAISDWQTPPKPAKILDVACGTGRTLKFIRHTCPQASLYGVDLSPYYLRRANQLLSKIPGELPQLLQANGEELPYVDNYFHGITSVFLFHELPYKARQRVIDECFRVLKPGGILVICDSIQKDDSPEITPVLNWFAQTFHEPYYQHYLTDDLGDRLQKAGFTEVDIQTHYLSKYWVAKKDTAPNASEQLRLD